MERTSEYYSTLTANSKARYAEKVTGAGLKTDPYSIPEESWTEEPVAVPLVSWSDLFLYMVSTPSLYTKQEMKVSFLKLFLNMVKYQLLVSSYLSPIFQGLSCGAFDW